MEKPLTHRSGCRSAPSRPRQEYNRCVGAADGPFVRGLALPALPERRRVVDREARHGLALHIRRFVTGRMRSGEFDINAIFSACDDCVNAISWKCDFLHDEMRDHYCRGPFALTRWGRQQVARWLLFLYSHYEYEWPRFDVFRLRTLLRRLAGRERATVVYGRSIEDTTSRRHFDIHGCWLGGRKANSCVQLLGCPVVPRQEYNR